MATVQSSYGDRDPNEQSCRTCKYWDGQRTWPADESETSRCELIDQRFPPYFSQALEGINVETVTRVTDSCLFHEYRQR